MATMLPDPDRLTSRTELATALSALREQAGLTVRQLAKRLDARPATLGGYFSGRHLPPANQTATLTALLRECGVTDPDAVDSWLAATDRIRAATDRRSSDHRAPFRGLSSYEAEDAALFFARNHEMDRLVHLVRDGAHPTIAVVGPSGSGKSSVLHAGLVAAIRAGRLDEPDGRCSYVVVTPGVAAIERLAVALDQLIEPGLRVLVIDQLEELFTSRYPLDVRYRYLELLEHRDPEIVVVFGLRADFYASAAREPVLLSALQDAQVLVGPLDREGVRETITGPTAEVGVTLENGFVDVVLADLGPQDELADSQAVSSLPLLGHALLATWNRSSRRRLTIDDYRATGGITGAVERTAESVYGELSDDGRRTARALFLRLVTVDDQTVTRRRIRWSELDGMVGALASEVSRTFVEARLLTAFSDGLEMSHEALLRSWPRLRGWIDDDREALRLRRRITDNAAEWERSDRDPAALLRGARLDTAAEWAAGAPADLALTASEQEYVDRGLAYAETQRQREHRAQRRVRQALAAVAVLAIVALVLAAVSLLARRSADQARHAATTARDLALSRQAAAEAIQLRTTDPALSMQLALAGYRISPTVEARSELLDSQALPTSSRLLGAPAPPQIALTGYGRILAVGRGDGTVGLWRTGPADQAMRTRSGVIQLPGKDGDPVIVAAAPDQRTLALARRDNPIQLWDIADPTRPRPVREIATQAEVTALGFSADGTEVAAATTHGVLRWRLNAANAATPAPGLDIDKQVDGLAYSPRTGLVATGSQDGEVRLWSVTGSTPRLVWRHLLTRTSNFVLAVAFSPDGRELAVGAKDRLVRMWRLTPGRAPAPDGPALGGFTSWVNSVAFSHDGRFLAAADSDASARVWDIAHRTASVRLPMAATVSVIAFGRQDRSVITGEEDGTIRSWPLPGGELAGPRDTIWNFAWDRSGDRLVIGSGVIDNAAEVWSTREPGHPVLASLARPTGLRGDDLLDGVTSISPTGTMIAEGTSDGNVVLWDVRQTPRQLGAPFRTSTELVESTAFSPDGQVLAAATDDKTVVLWDVGDPAHPHKLATLRTGGLNYFVAFSPQRHLLAAASADRAAHLWDVSVPGHPKLLGTLGGFHSFVYSVAFSADGRTIAAGSTDKSVRIWNLADLSNPRLLGKVTGPANTAYSVAFSPDSSHLAVGSLDNSVWLWDVRRPDHPQHEATLTAATEGITTVAFAPTGNVLAAGGFDNTLHLWSTDPSAVAAKVCALAGDRITKVEWEQYLPGAPYDPPCG